MRTAFIVIHGIGEQNPYESIDPFVRGLVKQLQRPDRKIVVSHNMISRKGSGGAPWDESYIHIAPVEAGTWSVDIHEYYWAYLTEKKISTSEVFQWVAKTLKGTKEFAQQNANIEKKYQNDTQYAHRMRSIYWAMVITMWAIKLVRLLVPRWFSWLRSIRGWVEGWGTAIIVGYIGDIAIYTTTDEKSEFFRIRQRILHEAQTLVDAVLADGYDRVILAGHSLGSVIAYDTLNRINIAANLDGEIPIDRLGGLITFGSPLDKIAFFFREHLGAKETVRRQILAHLHSFKARNLDLVAEQFPITNPLAPRLDELPWVNYYAEKDPVSGHLDFYEISEADNVKLPLTEKWGVAHTGYWEHDGFYADVVRRFLS